MPSISDGNGKTVVLDANGNVPVNISGTGTAPTVRTPADGLAEVPALVVEADLMGWDGAARQRLRVLSSVNPNLRVGMFDGSTAIVAISGIGDGGSGVASLSVGTIIKDGTGLFSPPRSASALNLAAQSGLGAALAASPGEWGIVHVPAVNTQATISRAAVAATRHVAKSITVSLIAGLAVTGVNTFVLRDGATGAGTILWEMSLSAVASDSKPVTVNVNLVGTANTAMTLETLAAPNTTTFATVALTGYDAS